MPPKPPLLKQGDLDGLCGPYAILNAIRSASTRHGRETSSLRALRVNDDLVSEIFLKMMQAVAGRSIADPVFWGIGTGRLMRLLAVASKILERKHGLDLTVIRPFSPERPVPPQTILARIAHHLKTEGAAVIIGSRSPWDHWTTVESIGRTRIRLADSGGYHYVPIRAGRSPSAPHAGLIQADCVFLLRLVPLETPRQPLSSLPAAQSRR